MKRIKIFKYLIYLIIFIVNILSIFGIVTADYVKAPGLSGYILGSLFTLTWILVIAFFKAEERDL